MMNQTKTYEELSAELEELRLQVQEANETLHAIKTGQIDAIFVENEKGRQLYTLKTADQTYRVFIEKMKEGAVTLNSNELILYSNSQFATMIGEPLSKVIGIPFRRFIPDIYKNEFDKLVKKGWGSDSKGELSLQNKTGQLIPFLLSFTSLELDDGMALSIILTDLSAQKNVEKELQLKNVQLEAIKQKISGMNEQLEETVEERTKDLLISREHFKFLADNIPVIVWTTGQDGSIDYFNKRWYEFTGLSPEQSMGLGSQAALYDADLEPTLNAWTQAIEKGAHFDFEYRIRRADGKYRWFLGKGHPLKDEEGKLVAWFGTSTDIEDQKKEMEKKDEFMSVASHELKTPLTSLKGYIQLMQQHRDLPDNIEKYISKANDSVNKLQHLINDLLDVSKIEAGKLKFDMHKLNLVDILNACIENSSYIYASLKIKKEIGKTLPVFGNGERLEQVIMNLVSNAVKYSPDKNEIIIRTTVENDRVTVSVIDFGIGLTETDQKRIFERFYRVENSNFFTSGLGMGLYISAQIIKEHHGKMQVQSQLNKGSSISFSLPLAGG